MNGTVRPVSSVPDAFSELVAGRLAAAGPGGTSLFCSGGDTAARCYRALAAATATATDGAPAGPTRVDWGTVEVYLGDERCVPPEDPDSNHRMVAETLLDEIGPVRADLPMYRSGPPQTAADSYQRVLESLGHFDIVHLGLGPDGHCASLFPGSTTLDIDDPATLVAATRDPSGAHPHDRITLTYPALRRARLVVFTVSGPSKADAWRRLVAGEDLPAARVAADEVLWLVDATAAG